MSLDPLSVVSLNGSPRAASRTETLVRKLAGTVQSSLDAHWTHYAITEIGPTLLPALTRDHVDPSGEAILRVIEAADVIVVGTPVYRASLTGALKHVFDLVDYRSLRGCIAVLAATGGNRHHGLVTEHQLRPLMSFFGAVTVPTAIYAEEADFDGLAIASPAIEARITTAAQDVLRLVQGTGFVRRTAAATPSTATPSTATPSTATLGELVP
jgi:FMN reductase